MQWKESTFTTRRCSSERAEFNIGCLDKENRRGCLPSQGSFVQIKQDSKMQKSYIKKEYCSLIHLYLFSEAFLKAREFFLINNLYE